VLSVSSIYPVGLVVNGASPPGSKFTRAMVSSPAFPHHTLRKDLYAPSAIVWQSCCNKNHTIKNLFNIQRLN